MKLPISVTLLIGLLLLTADSNGQTTANISSNTTPVPLAKFPNASMEYPITTTKAPAEVYIKEQRGKIKT